MYVFLSKGRSGLEKEKPNLNRLLTQNVYLKKF